ncbi:spore gernimation protein [Bacillus sp. FJAT-18017]|uniref:spore germination protein GerPE n=1 Tax=Bacillus sp. FJAT-18017 TaxID=1705566 RepID=UPI0006AF40C1|nr:spore germination protein GerPE [Bacillus sp. FJAT-18017]ALC91917.1 spore gernimation protein [Bacillus sp. FJAT-18017]
MLQRSSSVKSIIVESVQYSSLVQLGDTSIINGFSRAIAVQRERELFYGNEGEFASFPVFSKEIPLPLLNEPIQILSFNENPIIKVGSIKINGISSSSFLHVGNVNHISLEGRVKHIRQLEERDGYQ